MMIPRWLLFLVAAWVIAFGVYRLRVATQKRDRDADPERPNFARKGLFGRSQRSHILFGVLYLLLGGALVAMGLGWKPMIDPAGCGGDTEQRN
ncbi:MAG TPA: hypothetical protein VMZ28_28795 [Kofleriaceae bacterium]|nr:hypothetical protein [Kofleriaceae bacterium]